MRRSTTKMRPNATPTNRARKDQSVFAPPKLAAPKKTPDKTNSNYVAQSTIGGAAGKADPPAASNYKPAGPSRVQQQRAPAPPSPGEKKTERMKGNGETKGTNKKKSLEKEVNKKTVNAGTVRNRKKHEKNTTTTAEAKTVEEVVRQSAKSKKKLNSSDSSHKREREKSSENISNPKSSNSKEPSEEEKELKPKLNKSLAKTFFKEIRDRKSVQRHERRLSTEDIRLEMMPETSQLAMSVRAMKKKKKSIGSKPSAEDTSKELTDLFKPNGDPVWIVEELPPGQGEMTEDGTEIRNPELASALADDNLELEEKTTWADVVNQLIDDKLKPGKLMDRAEQRELDPYGDFEDLQKNNEFLSMETMNYLTAKDLCDMSLAAVQRFQRKQNGEIDEELRPRQKKLSKESSRPPSLETASAEDQLKTCYYYAVDFDLERNIFYVYDRRAPLQSVRALKKQALRSMETEDESKES